MWQSEIKWLKCRVKYLTAVIQDSNLLSLLTREYGPGATKWIKTPRREQTKIENWNFCWTKYETAIFWESVSRILAFARSRKHGCNCLILIIATKRWSTPALTIMVGLPLIKRPPLRMLLSHWSSQHILNENHNMFNIFVENRQTKFAIFKFWMCLQSNLQKGSI